MRGNLFLANVFLGTLLCFTLMERSAEASCDGLKGAAFGLCKAAYAVGCDDPVKEGTESAGCSKIVSNYSEITGETPPWKLPPCPCGTADKFFDYLYKNGEATSCIEEVGVRLSIGTSWGDDMIFSYYPGQTVKDPYAKQTCGYDSTSMYSLKDGEATSCIAEMRTVIDKFGFTCNSL